MVNSESVLVWNVQAVLKQFSGHGSQADNVITDEAELQRHQQLERLYISTKAGKVCGYCCFC